MRHDDDPVVRFFFPRDLLNFSVEPTKLVFVLLHVLLHGPVFDVVEVIEAGIDKVLLGGCDVGEERAAEDGYRWREVVPCLVEEDELPARLVFGLGLEREEVLLACCVRGVIRLVVAEYVEDDLEFGHVFAEEVGQAGVLGVADVSE